MTLNQITRSATFAQCESVHLYVQARQRMNQ